MDTKKEDTDVRTAPEAPAMPAPGEPGPGPSAVPSVPLHGPVDVLDDSVEGLRSAFRALSVEELDTNPVKIEGEREGCRSKHGRRRSRPWARPDE